MAGSGAELGARMGPVPQLTVNINGAEHVGTEAAGGTWRERGMQAPQEEQVPAHPGPEWADSTGNFVGARVKLFVPLPPAHCFPCYSSGGTNLR